MTTEVRSALLEFLKDEVTGPVAEDEVLEISPCERYTAGVLFPTRELIAERDNVGLADDEASGEIATGDITENPSPPPPVSGRPEESSEAATEVADDPILLANQYLPSAMGLTFVVAKDSPSITLRASASRYEEEKVEGRTHWRRQPLTFEPRHLNLEEATPAQTLALIPGRLSIRLSVHHHEDGSRLVRAVLVNESEQGTGSIAARSFFQAGLEVVGTDDSPLFQEYRLTQTRPEDPEVASLELLYRNRKTFALGHGCAADWQANRERASLIRTATVPTVKVPGVTPRSGEEGYLNMANLADLAGAGVGFLDRVLDQLPSSYLSWVVKQEDKIAEQVPAPLRTRAMEHLEECRVAAVRIRNGIELLKDDPDCRTAFELANRAMLMQQHHARRPSRKVDDPWRSLPTSYETSYEEGLGFWRAFQLAFILMNLNGIAVGGPERDLVDLIWFPTGGGKTEAYLGLAAFAIFLRRLREPGSAGCTVLMRYTLRLLTTQQFERAASMLAACELLRKEAPERLGENVINLGLWVGLSLSPNRRSEAVKSASALERGSEEKDNPFQLLNCPWCGTALDDPEHLGYMITSSPRSVRLVCPEGRCPFSSVDSALPVLVVDEDIYDTPPTFLLGTVDKFALLAWRPEAGTLFGLGRPELQPPSLIIQDELHLIAGPLGSIVGAYESVIDLLCTKGDLHPKIVASTATIRRAREQCKALYNRRASQFPPPGIDISDSWFATEDQEGPGRLYVGVLPTAAPSPVTAQVRVAATLLQGPKIVRLPKGTDEAARDPYWTLVQYFGSLRELGRAGSLVDADIPEYLRVIRRRLELPWDEIRQLRRAPELTSRRTASEIPQILSDLAIPCTGVDDQYPVDTVLATNMISVGVDIPRLGLMLVVGQPMSTSEYIQATSRVGRATTAPGLVVTLYNASKPRDRSHYEQFRSYHESFYRHVEPSSVTPFSVPVIDRTLHALLVITVRHLGMIQTPPEIEDAADVVTKLREHLTERVRKIAPEQEGSVVRRLQVLQQRWTAAPPDIWGRLVGPPQERPLMHVAGQTIDPAWEEWSWPTPTSMRSVDAECRIQVLPSYPIPGPGE